MSGAKSKSSNKQSCPVTRGGAATVASKLAKMAAEAPDEAPEILLMSKLVSKLERQRASLREDMSALIQNSVKPLQTSVDALHEMVNNFNGRLTAAESLAGDNFERVTSTKKTMKLLEAQNKLLQDCLEDLENRSRRVSLWIINIPEGSEKGQDPTEFISGLLMEKLGPGVFSKPAELERAHCSLAPKSGPGGNPRLFLICFHHFQEREKVLRWARQNELQYRGAKLRVYPDVSVATAKKGAAFNKVKQAFYQKRVKFRLLFPARLQVSYEDETFTFGVTTLNERHGNHGVGWAQDVGSLLGAMCTDFLCFALLL